MAACAVLGPLLGGAALILAYLVAIAYSYILYGPTTLPPGIVESVAGLALMVLMFSYIFGGLQALGSGLWLGYRAWRTGKVSAQEAIVTALAVSVLFFVAFSLWDTRDGVGDFRSNAGAGLSLGLLSVVAALTVRWLLIKLGVLPRNDASPVAST